MELEFDKEIDAILRKARPNKGVLVGDEPPEPKEPREQKKHVDADAIAAFAENALPEKARLLYIEHFADCDRCRQLLSRAILLNADADASEKSTATSISEPATETVIPWYESIFRTPNLALGMGALVLAFSGILGYLVLNQQELATRQTVSQLEATEQRHSGPYLNGENEAAIPTPSEAPTMSFDAQAASNTAANSASVMSGGATNTAAKPAGEMMSVPAANTAPAARSGQFQADGTSGSENSYILDGQTTSDVLAAKKPAAAPPPRSSQPQGGSVDSSISSRTAELMPKGLDFPSVLKTDAERDEKKLNEAPKDKSKRKAEDRGVTRDAPPPTANAGPSRAGPVQNQSNQINSRNMSEMSVTRVVTGKTFSNRDGAWYDSAYSGQATTNFRRGTNEYKKLDSGLRKIADTLGGTVVVMWKAKAYRIQ